jgi:hypothetical protein
MLGSNMLIEIGQVEAIYRYPVKSMRANQNHAEICATVPNGVPRATLSPESVDPTQGGSRCPIN